MTSDSASRGSAVIATSIAFTILAAFFVATRFLARAVFLKSAGRDEFAILGSLLCAIALLIATLEQAHHGLGKHFTAISTSEFEEVLKCLWVAILFYNISLTLTKISIVLQYLRVFVGPRIRYACWAAIILITVYGIETVTTAIWTCIPVSGFWTLDPSAQCINKKFLWFFNAAMNILTDLIILTLPMPVFSALKLPTKQKIGLMFIFALGGFVVLVSILRLHALYVVSKSDDITWDNTDAAIWSIIEVDTGIICASLPTIKPVISRLFPRLLSSNRSGQATQPSHSYPTSGFHSSKQYNDSTIRGAIRLDDVESPTHKTVTKIEASERQLENVARVRTTDDNGREIFVRTSVALDVESKSEMGSEKDLIFQR